MKAVVELYCGAIRPSTGLFSPSPVLFCYLKAERVRSGKMIIDKEFADRDEVKLWMIRNQLSRRNLTAFVRSELALKLKPLIAGMAKEKQREAGGAVCQKSDKAVIDTKRELAKAAGVSHDTIAKAEKIIAVAPEEVKVQLRNGDMSINQAYKQVKTAERKIALKRQVEELEQHSPEIPDGLFDVIVMSRRIMQEVRKHTPPVLTNKELFLLAYHAVQEVRKGEEAGRVVIELYHEVSTGKKGMKGRKKKEA